MRPSLQRVLTSALTSRHVRRLGRARQAMRRRLSGAAPTVLYFHQVDDPYSALTVQVLGPLLARYAVRLTPRLVSAPPADAAPEPERLAAYGRRDAAALAAAYGLAPPRPSAPPPALVADALALLSAARTPEAFCVLAPEVSACLWAGDRVGLAAMAQGRAAADPARIADGLAAGDAERTALGHYLGATFYFEGEWFWGLDRLHYLEARLIAAGLSTEPAKPPLYPALDLDLARGRIGAHRPRLDFWLSFRSPYTLLAAERIEALAQAYGARLVLRPVLPMVMRGLPVPRIKSRYIMLDTKREAERHGVAFGTMVDPVGRGAERGLAVLHHAIPAGLGPAFARSFLRGVFAEGVDSASEQGLDLLARRAGLSTALVGRALADPDWRAACEANRRELFELGLWGVPSFRVDDRPAWWGQDRLWAVQNDLEAATAAPETAKDPQS